MIKLTVCAIVAAALTFGGTASAGTSAQASCLGALVSAAAPGQSDFPPGSTADLTRLLHELAKSEGIPPGQTDAAIAKFHGSFELCLELFG